MTRLDHDANVAPWLLAAADRGVTTTVWHHPTVDGEIPPGLAGLDRSDVILRPCTPVRESLAVLDDVVWASSDALLGPVPGTVVRLDHSNLAAAVLRATRRRDSVDIAGSGRPAGRCACGRLQIRDETTLPAESVSVNGPIPDSSTYVPGSATPSSEEVRTEYSLDGEAFSEAPETTEGETAYRAVRWTLLTPLEPQQEEQFVYRVTIN